MRQSCKTQVVIIGSGFAGLGAAIRLRQAGIEDVVILERAGDVGGTWRDNAYPGCACDVESHLYSFSFAPNPQWSHSFSRQPEIWDYLRRVARDYRVLPLVRFEHEATDAAWDDASQRWRVETSRGERFEAPLLVMASGALSDPVVPSLPGLERFGGRVFHSARWDHGFDLRGKRVAVIGTGASAIQFVPQIQPLVERLHLFQRTAPWVMPRHDRALGAAERALLRRAPGLRRLLRAWIYLRRELYLLPFRRRAIARVVERVALRHMARAVKDPALRRTLTPPFRIGCKRVLISNDYYPAVAQPNVEVVAGAPAEVRPRGVVGPDGVERPADAIIFGTGFQPTDPPLARHVRGREGRTLADVWAGSPGAYAGTTVAGFPNLFVLPGPNTGLGHTSVVYMLEAQLAHVVAVVRHLRRSGAGAVEPRPAAQAAWLRGVDRRMAGTAWVTGGCRSWYLDATGRNSTLWPDFTWRYRRRVARLVPDDYVLLPARRDAERAPVAAD